MNPTQVVSLINILIHALGAVPTIQGDIQEALQAHWGKDHVQQGLQGLGVLNKIVGDVSNAVGAAPPVPASVEPPVSADTPPPA